MLGQHTTQGVRPVSAMSSLCTQSVGFQLSLLLEVGYTRRSWVNVKNYSYSASGMGYVADVIIQTSVSETSGEIGD